MNAVVQFDASVPAFLRNAGFLQLNQKAAAGLSMGSPPRLSFRGSRFRFIAADGTETLVTENNGVAVDVVVVDASQHVSKFYYDKAYDPNADDMAPACFSDNGVGPSVRATTPQALHCAGCPKNAWGSKVTPQGSQVKACSDIKKLAVIPVSNMDGPAYVLGIPGASLKGWTAAVNALTQRGIPVPALVIRLGFDASAEYPKLTFSPTRWINEQEAEALQDLFGSDEVAELVGSKDTPIQAMPALGAPAPVFAAPAPAPAPVFAPATPAAAAPAAEAPKRRGRRPAAPPAPAAAAPAAAPAAPPASVAPAVHTAAPPPPSDIGAMLDSIMGNAAA